ncbi:hypothetical protein QQS21_004134 [Conoideocrella luteorostrata]|uniref:cellulase n=1 Tax=Conoideocrella luteorostrata TaxID=1105319 RepID=A0AAJ0CUF0_9HYPO|nr:hypothetical protein QQS21_004134 [Conoideocrella luteorostrata]
MASDPGIIVNTNAFKSFWQNLASTFRDNERVIFDTNNEFHDIDQPLVMQLNQAAIDGINASRASTQYIMVEGNDWSGAWTWAKTNDKLKELKDPFDKSAHEMHQCLDRDGSGNSDLCVTKTVGARRVSKATSWLRDNKKVGFLGEFANGTSDKCKQAHR